MRRLALSLACLLLAASPGSGQDTPLAEIEGYVHEVVDPLVQTFAPVFALYPVDGPDGPDGSREVFLTPGTADIDFAPLRGRRVTLRGQMNLLLGPQRRLIVDEIASCDDHAAVDALIAEELGANRDRWFLDGTAEPQDGFDARELRCPDGELARVVPIRSPEPNSADMETETAYVCTHSCQYWAHLTGGFAGSDLWLGPFDLPGTAAGAPRIEQAPTSVRPRGLRVRRRSRMRRLTIRREIDPADTARVGRDRYAPEDFDLGEGLAVRRVLRVAGNRVRVAVLVSRNAAAGERHPRLLGRSGQALLTIARR